MIIGRRGGRTQALIDARSELQSWGSGDERRSAAANTALEVDEILAQLRLDPEIRAAALLQPPLRAGALEADALTERWGERVSRIARDLDRIGRLALPAPRRWSGRRQQVELLRRMLLVVMTDPRLAVVRLAEELQRLREMKDADEATRKAAAEASLALFAPLASRLGLWQLKWALEDWAFRHLDPATYRDIAERLSARRAEREEDVARIVSGLREELARAGLHAEVLGRPKHIYSIWRKMQRKGLDFDLVHDIRAVRVLVESVSDCYAVLSLVHDKWRYLPSAFDDYIAKPKPNGYRSLHTTVLGPDEKPLEIQIRTFQMDEEAELGVAAHWLYKDSERYDETLQLKIRWLRNFISAAPSPSDEESIERVTSELLADRVYAFTPKGDVVELPAGATPLDFAYQVHTEIGHRCRGARVDGRIVPLTHRLETGQQVEIITAANAQPSRDWLRPGAGYLASARSRAKVRAWLRRQDQERHRREGRAFVERELQRLRRKDYPLQQLAERLGYRTVDAMCVAVGAGEAAPGVVARALQEDRVPAEEPKRPSGVATARAPFTVAGLDEMLSGFAGCCRPVPPEPIRGYVTRISGVRIHRADCGNLRRLLARAPNRGLELDWGNIQGATFPVDITVRANDEEGLLDGIESILADEGVALLSSRTHPERGGVQTHIELGVAINGTEQLSRLLHRLHAVSGVIEARRR